MTLSCKAVALEARLKSCRNVITLGVKPNFADYSHSRSRAYSPFPKGLLSVAVLCRSSGYGRHCHLSELPYL